MLLRLFVIQKWVWSRLNWVVKMISAELSTWRGGVVLAEYVSSQR